jgi:hypothetical protein
MVYQQFQLQQKRVNNNACPIGRYDMSVCVHPPASSSENSFVYTATMLLTLFNGATHPNISIDRIDVGTTCFAKPNHKNERFPIINPPKATTEWPIPNSDRDNRLEWALADSVTRCKSI